jgi:succinate dehydrogenase/fumarate reductase flavoprotein subunit
MSIPFCIVTGTTAGRWASQYALEDAREVNLKYKKPWIEEKRRGLDEILQRAPDEKGNPRKIKALIKSTMLDNVGPLRKSGTLKGALKTLEQIKAENLPFIYSKSLRELREATEAINMVTTAEIVTRSALYRTESRGLHQRMDYPERDDKNWLKNVFVKSEKDGMKLFDRPVQLIWAKPK